VYIANDESRAQFKPVKVGLEDNQIAEIVEGLREGEVIVSTGAGALRRNDQLQVAGAGAQQPGAPGPPGQGGRQGMGNRRPPGAGQGGAGQGRPQGGQAPSGQEPGRRPQTERQLQQRPIA
jgi:hypothetical protein